MPEADTQTDSPRKVHTDGWNSFWHVFLGMIAAKYPAILVPICLGYQLMDPEELNVCVDILEFLYGFLAGTVLRVIM
jgi:hypothetical protein